jgi:hypothetical protein
MRGLKRHRSAQTLAAGHALVQNLRRGHYDIATDVPDRHRLRIAFDDLALTDLGPQLPDRPRQLTDQLIPRRA